MAQLRTGAARLRARRPAPADVVERVNRLLWHSAPTTMTTLAYLVLDPERETLDRRQRRATRRRSSSRRTASARVPRRSPAGSRSASRAARATASTTFPVPGRRRPSLLFTDGAVEVRGESIDDGLERLRALAARGHADVEALCDAVDRAAGAPTRARPTTSRCSPLRLTAAARRRCVTRWPATPDALASVRHLLRRWLRGHGATDDEIYDITVACQEACANAVEHAYAPGDAAFEVEATLAGRHDRDRRARPRPLAARRAGPTAGAECR